MKTQPKADCINSFILPDLLLSLDTFLEHLAKGGTIRDMGGPGMAAPPSRSWSESLDSLKLLSRKDAQSLVVLQSPVERFYVSAVEAGTTRGFLIVISLRRTLLVASGIRFELTHLSR